MVGDGEFAGKSEFNAKAQRRKENNSRFASLRLCVFALMSVPAPAGRHLCRIHDGNEFKLRQERNMRPLAAPK